MCPNEGPHQFLIRFSLPARCMLQDASEVLGLRHRPGQFDLNNRIGVAMARSIGTSSWIDLPEKKRHVAVSEPHACQLLVDQFALPIKGSHRRDS